MATVYVGGASIDENGRISGGRAGNQTGRELRKQAYYVHSKGWRVLRAKNREVGKLIADDMRMAIANMKIGYDQNQRNTLYKLAEKVGFNCSRVLTACETDCSALVRVCCAYAGLRLPDFNTASEAETLLASGQFVEMKGTKYTKQGVYLQAGDILVTATKGHTVVVLNDGSKAEITENTGGGSVTITLDELERGAKGAQVFSAQSILKQRGYNLGRYGVDGDFGGDTLEAVKAFQRDTHITIDGIIGNQTWNKLIKG